MQNVKQILFEIACTEEERVEIRAQAMLVVIDLTILFPRLLAQNSIQSCEENSQLQFMCCMHSCLMIHLGLSLPLSALQSCY